MDKKKYPSKHHSPLLSFIPSYVDYYVHMESQNSYVLSGLHCYDLLFILQ